jgi:hypothetical protein
VRALWCSAVVELGMVVQAEEDEGERVARGLEPADLLVVEDGGDQDEARVPRRAEHLRGA